MDQQSKEYQRGIYGLQIGHMKGLMLTKWKGALLKPRAGHLSTQNKNCPRLWSKELLAELRTARKKIHDHLGTAT